MAAADTYNFDETVNRTRHESALGLPPSDKLFQRMELARRLVRRHEEAPSLPGCSHAQTPLTRLKVSCLQLP